MKSRAARLTEVERRVVYWVAFDKSNKEIASQLGKSEKTIEKQRENASRKLGVRTPIEFARAAIACGVVEVNSWLAKPFGPVRPSVYSEKNKRRQYAREVQAPAS